MPAPRNMLAPRTNRLAWMVAVTLVLGSASSAFAWGWWAIGSMIVGGLAYTAACVVTAGGALVVGAAVAVGTGTGIIGTAAKGDSVYDDIVASPAHPVVGPLVHQRPDPVPNIVQLYHNPSVPPQAIQEFNLAHQALADELQWARGVREACRRYYGAQLMSDVNAMRLQAQYALEFVNLEEQSLNLGLAHFASVSAQLRPIFPRTADFFTTASEARQIRDMVRAEGLPQCWIDEMNQLNIEPHEQALIQQYVAAPTDAEINDYYFTQSRVGQIFVCDQWDEMIRQFRERLMRDAVPAEIKAFWNTGCVADVDDGSGTGTPDGGVTIDDLLYYLSLFENGDIRADVDDGSGTGTRDGGVTIDDLLYYLLRFESGC